MVTRKPTDSLRGARSEMPGNPGNPGDGRPAGSPVLDPHTETSTRLARQYRVLIHNDDVTTAAFVIDVLVTLFHLGAGQAMEIMSEAHNTGVALVGVYPLERAEFLVDQAHSKARAAKFPLTFTYEPEDA